MKVDGLVVYVDLEIIIIFFVMVIRFDFIIIVKVMLKDGKKDF